MMVTFHNFKRIHLVGIGGIGMSGIAEVLLTLGYTVSGSDVKTTAITERLQNLGAEIFEGHKAEHIHGAHVVVVSSAVRRDNPEIAEAVRHKIPVIPRAEMLAELMRLKYGIAIAGAHGKTTTTSMTASVLAAAGLDPTFVVGGRVNHIGATARLGRGEYMVVEADESDRTFLLLAPVVAVVTTIDREHLDTYKSITEIQEIFTQFVNRVPFYGAAVLCLDEANVQAIIPNVHRPVMTYGTSNQADLVIGEIGLQEFAGVGRRFEVKGVINGITLIDDYGHHPAEIRATLEAARGCNFNRILVLFQPHRYTRTRHLWDDFCSAFNQADLVVLMDIYAAGEPPIPGITGQALADAIRAAGHKNVVFHSSMQQGIEELLRAARPGDAILTIGAGNVSRAPGELAVLLGARVSLHHAH